MKKKRKRTEFEDTCKEENYQKKQKLSSNNSNTILGIVQIDIIETNFFKNVELQKKFQIEFL